MRSELHASFYLFYQCGQAVLAKILWKNTAGPIQYTRPSPSGGDEQDILLFHNVLWGLWTIATTKSKELLTSFCNFLCITQDSKLKVNSNLTLSEQVSVATICLKEGHSSLTEHTPQQTLNFDFIEGLAKARYALGIVAEVLCTRSPSGVEITRWQELLEITKAIVEDVKINQVDAGPAIYLLKLIVRRYGLSLMTILQKQHHWLVPASFTKYNKVYAISLVEPNSFLNALLVLLLVYITMHS